MPIRLRLIPDFIFLVLFGAVLIAYPLNRIDQKVVDLQALKIPWSRGISIDFDRMQIQATEEHPEIGLQISGASAPIQRLVLEISFLSDPGDTFFLFYIPHRYSNEKFHVNWKASPEIKNTNGRKVIKWSFLEPISGERIRIAIPDEANFTIEAVDIAELGNAPLWLKIFAVLVLGYGCVRGVLFIIGCFIENPFYYKVVLLIIWIVGLILFKFWTIQGIPLVALGNNDFDDTLFLELSQHLLNGEWLGPYNMRTLIKGVGYPIWIAGSFIVGLPLSVSQELLYVGASLLLLIVLALLMKRPFLFLSISTPFLIFNPGTFNNEVVRVIRDGIYPALTLWIIFFSTGLILWKRKPICQMTLWAIGQGLFLAAFFLTREEGIWLAPMLFIFISHLMYSILHSENLANKKTRIGICLMPFFICGLLISGVSTLNFLNYGLFCTTELKTHAFSNAYASLTRVIPPRLVQYVPVSRATRKMIYDVSPAFRELKKYFEGDLGQKWAKASYSVTKQGPENIEIGGGQFVFALREAVAKQGYHSDTRAAINYYGRLSKEVDEACDKGLIQCFPKTNLPPLAPVWQNEYLNLILKDLARDLYDFFTFQNLDVSAQHSRGTKQSLQIFRDLTWDKLAPLPNESKETGMKARVNLLKTQILKWIANTYTLLLHFIVPLAIFSYIYCALIHFWDRSFPFLVIFNSAVLFSVFSRFFLLMYLDKAAFPALNAQYLASGYALLLVFCITAIADLMLSIKKYSR